MASAISFPRAWWARYSATHKVVRAQQEGAVGLRLPPRRPLVVPVEGLGAAPIGVSRGRRIQLTRRGKGGREGVIKDDGSVIVVVAQLCVAGGKLNVLRLDDVPDMGQYVPAYIRAVEQRISPLHVGHLGIRPEADNHVEHGSIRKHKQGLIPGRLASSSSSPTTTSTTALLLPRSPAPRTRSPSPIAWHTSRSPSTPYKI